MGVVRFNGGSMKWTTLAAALANVSDADWTYVTVIKRAVDDSNFHGLGFLLSGAGAGTTEAGISIDNGDSMRVDVSSFTEGSVPTVTGTTEAYMLVAGKQAGNNPVEYSRYVESTDTWTHDTTTATLSNQIAATMLELGAWQEGDLANLWMGVSAFYEGLMSQANREALATNWRTSDLWLSAHGQPEFLAELNTATPTDLAGNASDFATTGSAPTLDNGETLASWNFDGTGEVIDAIPHAPRSRSRQMFSRPGRSYG